MKHFPEPTQSHAQDPGRRSGSHGAPAPRGAARVLEWALGLAVIVVLVLSLGLAIADRAYFSAVFAAEDGPVEYGTAIFLFIGALVLGLRAARAGPGIRQKVCLALYALLFLFAAGEEISWGQRLLGIESGAFFLAHNDQAETTLHNLVIGGVKLDELVFGNLLSLVLLLYLLALPFAWRAWGWTRRLVRALAIPVPQRRHAALTLAATAAVLAIGASRKWEVYEFAFSVIALMIFVAPQNAGPVRQRHRR